MKKIFVVANWKMNPLTKREAEKLFSEARKIKNKNCTMVICPPFPFLSLGKNLSLGAQNCAFQKSGSVTGEVSPYMLKDISCDYVILGHSERRRLLGESLETINKKVKVAISSGITPILCVSEETKDELIAIDQIREQIQVMTKKVSFSKIIIVYEPLFAITPGDPCPIHLAAKRRVLVKSIISKINSRAKDTPVLYGGSVDEKNCKDYIEEANFQGLLVGASSLDAKKFKKIVESI